MANTQSSRQAPLLQRALAHAWYYWGLSLNQWGLRTGDHSFYHAAISSFNRAVGVWPEFAAAYFRRGIILSRELGDHRGGLKDLDNAIAYAPEWAELYLQRGLILRFHGDPNAAAQDLRHFIELDPSSSWRGEAEHQLLQIAGEPHD